MIEAIGRPNLLTDGFPPTGLVKAPATIALDSPDDVPGHPHMTEMFCVVAVVHVSWYSAGLEEFDRELLLAFPVRARADVYTTVSEG